ncbi:MAG: Cellulase [Candidatus Brocadiaceae bacterium]|nr:Cellulase [Candidatus Brocadiaceae bacterium]
MFTKRIFIVIVLLLTLSCIGCIRTMEKKPELSLKTWWELYKQSFVQPDGRVQRPEHGFDTVSEGQAYAMLFSVFMEDRDTFDLIYNWTEKHLSRKNEKGDHLLAWHWEGSGVSDWMPASDADCDYAFALLLASQRWNSQQYREKALQVSSDILSKETVRGDSNRLFLLPGIWGNEKDGYLIQNPSYYSPAAFRLFYEATKDNRYLDLIETCYWILDHSCARMNDVQGCGLIPDWCTVDPHGNIIKAEDRSGDYGWESVRIPMRMGLDAFWFGTKEGQVVLKNIYQILNTLNAGSGEIKAVYRYTGEPAVEFSSLPATAMAYFTAQVLGIDSDSLNNIFKNKMKDTALVQNYYGQSLAFFPLAFENKILKIPQY